MKFIRYRCIFRPSFCHKSCHFDGHECTGDCRMRQWPMGQVHGPLQYEMIYYLIYSPVHGLSSWTFFIACHVPQGKTVFILCAHLKFFFMNVCGGGGALSLSLLFTQWRLLTSSINSNRFPFWLKGMPASCCKYSSSQWIVYISRWILLDLW